MIAKHSALVFPSSSKEKEPLQDKDSDLPVKLLRHANALTRGRHMYLLFLDESIYKSIYGSIYISVYVSTYSSIAMEGRQAFLLKLSVKESFQNHPTEKIEGSNLAPRDHKFGKHF